MKNYIEREIKIKYIEGLLNKSKEWQWYINYLEEKFEVNFSMNSFSDFKSIFIEVKEVFESLIKINEIVESDLIFQKIGLILLISCLCIILVLKMQLKLY